MRRVNLITHCIKLLRVVQYPRTDSLLSDPSSHYKWPLITFLMEKLRIRQNQRKFVKVCLFRATKHTTKEIGNINKLNKNTKEIDKYGENKFIVWGISWIVFTKNATRSKILKVCSGILEAKVFTLKSQLRKPPVFWKFRK